MERTFASKCASPRAGWNGFQGSPKRWCRRRYRNSCVWGTGRAGRANRDRDDSYRVCCGRPRRLRARRQLGKAWQQHDGCSILATELDAKKIELLKELLPDAKRFGVINDPATSGGERSKKIDQTARHLGVEIQTIDVHGPTI